MVTAALRMDSADVAVYTRVLTKSLSEALPPDYVTVERERSMSDRMRGRPGEISKVQVRLGDQLMTLAVRNGTVGRAPLVRRDMTRQVIGTPSDTAHSTRQAGSER